ncbi:hypothetical protein SAMN06295987_10360 [Novosphingobium mathurense]|uniref:Beta/Gamma crystallin n=1 Tax=Novosphingobium mathurense TaxID=428990 RepID=A0A1U6HTV1_9SPHN|nr:hypothetical protein SAMN06295987_10360 [Novosphingobium mathurense]
MKDKATLRGTAFLAGTVLIAVAMTPGAQAKTPSDVSDVVGARSSSGEGLLQDRGYENISTKSGTDRKWTYWWNKSKSQCITVTTFDGRYEAIDKASNKDCGKSGGGNGTAVAVVGAAALIGALAITTSKKKDKDRDDYYPSGSSRTTPYELRDLIGIKASSGERQMGKRGYKFKSSGTGTYSRWAYWWNKHDDQCVAVTTRDGRYDSIVSVPDSSCGSGSNYGYGGRGDASFSPSRDITCYPAQRVCYERNKGYSAYWTSREFRY